VSFGAEGGPIRFKPVSVSQFQKSPCQLVSIISQSQEVQKKCSKTVNFLQFLLKTRSFLQKKRKKVQKITKKC
jgi:hypothetical protein